MIILALITGFLNSLKGRGLSEKYGLVYSRNIFLAAMCALIFLANNSIIETIAGLLIFGVVTWTGTGGLMQAFSGHPQKEPEFKPIDFIVSKILNMRGHGIGYSQSEYRKYGVWYASLISVLQFFIAVVIGSWGAPLLLLSGLIIGAMRYLPTKYSIFSWLICEIILGTIMFLSVTLRG